jgi:hypothetical protein
MHCSKDLSQEDMDNVLATLVDVLSLLGWVVEEPKAGVTDGLLIGTPEFIEAWNDLLKKRKGEIQ